MPRCCAAAPPVSCRRVTFDELDHPHAFGAPRDPLELADGEHPGVASLRAAVLALEGGDIAAALEAADATRRAGVPAELVPHRALVHGVALVLDGDPAAAATLLGDAWSAHPDVAALPAALGAARTAAGDAHAGAQAMFAALVSDDPDGSLAIHRRRLTLLLGAVRAGS